MQQCHKARKLVVFAVIGIFIQGCSPSEDELDSATTIATAALEQSYDVALSGSVGDGPIVDAVLTVFAKDGGVLSNTISDQNASYNLQVRTQGKHYPLTIEASAGFDLVTRLPADFKMLGAVTSPRNRTIANLNPFTTLAVATARQMSGGLSAINISTALRTVVSEFNLGLTSQLSLDPMTIPIDDSNLAEIMKSSEALGEIFRRTATTLRAVSFNASNQFVIDAIAADLVDGALDGEGAARANRQISATTVVVSAQVALEAMRNELRVNGELITPVLDEVIRNLSSGPPQELSDARPVTSDMIEQALEGVDAAIALGSSSSLDSVRAALGSMQPGVSAASARQSLPVTAAAALDGPVLQVGSGSAAAVDAVLPASAAAGNRPPAIAGTPPASVPQGTFFQFIPSATDADGDNLTFSLTNGPAWLDFSASTGELSGLPGVADIGTYSNIRMSVTDGQATTSLPLFSIAVQAAVPPAVNTPPVISGTPASSVLQETAYVFVPGVSDADSDTLTFTITNRPIWAAFDTMTGELTGTPGASDLGTYASIRIRVSDGQSTVGLPSFSITVLAAPSSSSSNTPPVISGTPGGSVLQGTRYQFVPNASDADGDTLTFSIVNRPAWAAFSPATGALTGTPGPGDVATYANIAISVNDGQSMVTLQPFTVTVDAIGLGSATLSWDAPTTNVDGSPLLDLAGYRIHWGQQSGAYTNTVTVMNPGITIYVVENLSSGTYYFSTTALRSNGLESAFSNEGTKTIP